MTRALKFLNLIHDDSRPNVDPEGSGARPTAASRCLRPALSFMLEVEARMSTYYGVPAHWLRKSSAVKPLPRELVAHRMAVVWRRCLDIGEWGLLPIKRRGAHIDSGASSPSSSGAESIRGRSWPQILKLLGIEMGAIRMGESPSRRVSTGPRVVRRACERRRRTHALCGRTRVGLACV